MKYQNSSGSTEYSNQTEVDHSPDGTGKYIFKVYETSKPKIGIYKVIIEAEFFLSEKYPKT